MKRRSILLVAVIAGMTVFLLAAGLYAGTEVKDVIKLQEPSYEHTKGIIEFSHTKHHDEYAKKAPDLYTDGCGACHHDADNKPLKNLKAGDNVKRCVECHKKPGEVPKELKKEWKAKKVSKKEQDKISLEYHAEALHENCRGCHKDYNKKYKTKDAPTSCTKCHPKTK